MAEINRLVVEVDVSQLSSAAVALEAYIEVAKKAALATKQVKTGKVETPQKPIDYTKEANAMLRDVEKIYTGLSGFRSKAARDLVTLYNDVVSFTKKTASEFKKMDFGQNMRGFAVRASEIRVELDKVAKAQERADERARASSNQLAQDLEVSNVSVANGKKALYDFIERITADSASRIVDAHQAEAASLDWEIQKEKAAREWQRSIGEQHVAGMKANLDEIDRKKRDAITVERALQDVQTQRYNATIQGTKKVADAVAKEADLVRALQDAYKKAPRRSQEKSDYYALLSNWQRIQTFAPKLGPNGMPTPVPLFSEAAIETLNRYNKGIESSDKALKTHHQTLRGFVSDLKNSDTAFGEFLRFGTEVYLAMRAVQTIYRVVSSGISAIIQASTQLESLSRALGALSGSVAKGQILTGFIGELSRTLPVSSAALGEASKALMGYGFSMTEVVDILPTLAQITQNNADKMEGLAIVYGQVRSQGRAYYDDVRQFVTAGIPVVETLAKVLKIPVEDVRKAVREGKADIEVFDQALRMLTEEGGQFHNRLQAELDTTRGKVTLLKNEWQTLLQALGDSQIPKAAVSAIQYLVGGLTYGTINTQLMFAANKARSKDPATSERGKADLSRLVATYPDIARTVLEERQRNLTYDARLVEPTLRGKEPDYKKFYSSPDVVDAVAINNMIGNELRRVGLAKMPVGGTGDKTPSEADAALALFKKQMEGEARYLAMLKSQATKADYAKAVTSTAGTRESLYESTFKQIASLPNSAPVIASLNTEYQKWVKAFGPAATEKKEKIPVEQDIMDDFVKKLRGLTMRLGEDDDYAKFIESRTSLIDSTTQRAFEEGFGQDSALYKKIVFTGLMLSEAMAASEKRYLATMAPGRNEVTKYGATERGTARWEQYAGYDYGPYADLRKSMVDTLTSAVTDANLTGNIDDALQKGNTMWGETLTELMRRGASEADITAIRDVFVDVMKPVEDAAYLVRAIQNPTYTDSYTGRFGWQRTGGTQTAEDTNALIELKDSATQWEAIFGQPIKDFTIAVSKFGIQISMMDKELSLEELQTAYRQALVSVDVATKELEVAQAAYTKAQNENEKRYKDDPTYAALVDENNRRREFNAARDADIAKATERWQKADAALLTINKEDAAINVTIASIPKYRAESIHWSDEATRKTAEYTEAEAARREGRTIRTQKGQIVPDEQYTGFLWSDAKQAESKAKYYALYADYVELVKAFGQTGDRSVGYVTDKTTNRLVPVTQNMVSTKWADVQASFTALGSYSGVPTPVEKPPVETPDYIRRRAAVNREEDLASKALSAATATPVKPLEALPANPTLAIAETGVTAAKSKLIMAQANAQALEEAAKAVPLWKDMEKIQGQIVEQEAIRDANAEAWTQDQQGKLQGLYKELYATEKISQVWSNLSKMSLDALYSSFMDVASSLGTLFATGEGNPLETFAKSILNALPSILLAGAKSAFEIPGGKGFWLGMGLLISAGVGAGAAAYANSSSSSSSSSQSHGTFYEDAMGGAYDQYGRVAAFANGGVFTNKIVSRPTFFQHGGGFGVMGEAGEEGILPLTRVNGKLGVHATGGGSPTTVFQIIDQRSSGADIETREEERADGTKLITAIIRDAVRKTIASGEQDTTFKRFGLVPLGARRM